MRGSKQSKATPTSSSWNCSTIFTTAITTRSRSFFCAIATVVSTKVLTPRQAIAMAAFFNLTGALMGTAVASTIGKGMVDSRAINMKTVLCALLGAIIWNLLTWWLGLPSSSTHALIGGLIGAALVQSGSAGVQWNGVWEKVIV